jgi:hypothetical protein
MKSDLNTKRNDRFYQVGLIGLTLATIVPWLSDPSHQPTGGSRIPWPVWSQSGQ